MATTACNKPAASLLKRAVALLARREHSRVEMARKLTRRLDEGQDRADVDAVLDELQRRDLLSEERFAAAVVRARASRYGDARLKQDLKSRGATPDAAAAALDAVRGSELERARAVWTRRFGRPPASLQERARQVRFLEARGFSASVIRRVLTGLPGDDSGESGS
jgi:regulatory protein